MTLTTSSWLECPPLHGTPRSPERETIGPAIAEVAALLGKPLYPWQRHVADIAGELDPDTGELVYDEVVVIGPRQIGKTELRLPTMTQRCIGWSHLGPQTVLYTAQTADAARERWRDTDLPRLLGASLVRRQLARPGDKYGGARLRLNAEAIFWRNGSRWSPGSTTAKRAGTGDTLDLAVIDEAWARPDDRTELGLTPAMDTRTSPQLWVFSMIPGPTRARPGTWAYLAGKRAAGRRLVAAGVRRGTAFFDWAASPGSDPADPVTWRAAHPGVGFSTSVERLRSRFDRLSLADFGAEYLGLDPDTLTPKWQVISENAWSGLVDEGSGIAGLPALAVDVNDERTTGWICAAGRRADGHWHVELIEPGFKVPAGTAGIDWIEPRLREIYAAQRAFTVTVDPARPGASLIEPLKRAGLDVTRPNQREVAAACGRLFDATGQARPSAGSGPQPDPVEPGVRVLHLGQAELSADVAGTMKIDMPGGGFIFAPGGPLYVSVLAMLGHVAKFSQVKPRSMIW